VPNFAGTQAACLDFAVTHTQQLNVLHCASMCGGAAAERYEVTVKDAKFGVECKAAGLVLVPMVVEVFARWGVRSVEAMKLATKGCAHRASERVPAAGAHVRRSLSVTLQRLNARILGPAGPCCRGLCGPIALPVGPRIVAICRRGCPRP
jgi:hypothetical protein